MSAFVQEIFYFAIDTRSESVTRAANAEDYRGMDIVSIAGIIFDQKRYWTLKYSEDPPESCVVGDIVDSAGEWSALAVSREHDMSKYLLVADHAGHAPIFYSLVPGIAIVASDSFSGVVQGLKELDVSPSLNFSYYLTSVTGRSATFETLISHQTMANEIFILRPDEALFVDHDVAIVINRAQLSAASQIDQYDQALHSAIDYSTKTIERYVTENSGAQPVLTLTGGVDSRLVLALLSATPYLREFKIWTMDPRNARNSYQKKVYTADVEISNQIRKAFKLDWMPSRKREKVAVSFEESLARHQGFYSNYSFKFSPSDHVSLEKTPLLTLRGGGGELLRGTGGARLASDRYNEYRKNGGKLEQVRWAANDYLERSFLADDFAPIAQEFLVEQLNHYKGTLLREKLDAFYRDTRNRAHFGHYRVSADANDYLVHVLSNPFFQRVADLATYEYASSNGIVRDIFDATEPKLRRFPFENPTAHDQLHLRHRKPFKYRARDSWVEDFDAISDGGTTSSFRFMGAPDERGLPSQQAVRTTSLKYLRDAFKAVESLTPTALQENLAAQHENLIKQIRRDRLSIGRVIAKVASALDIVAPMPLNAARHFFTHYRTAPRIGRRDSLHDGAQSYAFYIGSLNHKRN